MKNHIISLVCLLSFSQTAFTALSQPGTSNRSIPGSGLLKAIKTVFKGNQPDDVKSDGIDYDFEKHIPELQVSYLQEPKHAVRIPRKQGFVAYNPVLAGYPSQGQISQKKCTQYSASQKDDSRCTVQLSSEFCTPSNLAQLKPNLRRAQLQPNKVVAPQEIGLSAQEYDNQLIKFACLDKFSEILAGSAELDQECMNGLKGCVCSEEWIQSFAKFPAPLPITNAEIENCLHSMTQHSVQLMEDLNDQALARFLNIKVKDNDPALWKKYEQWIRTKVMPQYIARTNTLYQPAQETKQQAIDAFCQTQTDEITRKYTERAAEFEKLKEKNNQSMKAKKWYTFGAVTSMVAPCVAYAAACVKGYQLSLSQGAGLFTVYAGLAGRNIGKLWQFRNKQKAAQQTCTTNVTKLNAGIKSHKSAITTAKSLPHQQNNVAAQLNQQVTQYFERKQKELRPTVVPVATSVRSERAESLQSSSLPTSAPSDSVAPASAAPDVKPSPQRPLLLKLKTAMLVGTRELAKGIAKGAYKFAKWLAWS